MFASSLDWHMLALAAFMVGCSSSQPLSKPVTTGTEKVSRRSQALDSGAVSADSSSSQGSEQSVESGETPASSRSASKQQESRHAALPPLPATKPPSGLALRVLAAKPGDQVVVQGVNLHSGLSVRLAGRLTLALTLLNATSAAFAMPRDAGVGVVQVEVQDRGATLANLSLVSDSADDGLPVMLVEPSIICRGVSYRDGKGRVRAGERDCSPAPPLCGGEGDSSCVLANDFVAVRRTSLNPAAIRVGVTIGGVAGRVTPAPSACSVDGDIGCVANTTYPAVLAQTLTPANIRVGVTLGGVAGLFPSNTYPLSSAGRVPDLDDASFQARIKSAATFQWFDSTGRRYEATGDGDLTAEHVLSGVTIFGTMGTVSGAVSCSADGQQGCVVNGIFKAADVRSLSSMEVRFGRTVAGVAGGLTFFKNMASTAVFNRDSGAGASANLDVYDTVDDHANGGSFPNQAPPGFGPAAGSGWQRDTSTDDGAGGGTPLDQLCNGSEACVFNDTQTGMQWARVDGTLRTFENAIAYCDGLIYAGRSDWRLPSQKELMQAYINGIWNVRQTNKLNMMSYVWSATTVSYATSAAWLVYINYGSGVATPKTSTGYTLCVR